MKIILVLLAAFTLLTGCASVERQAKTVTDTICNMSDAEKSALAEQFDKITSPNKIRVICKED